MLALVVIAGGIAWGLLIAHRGYNYDEVVSAHSIWMTSQGLRPYHDFFECHPPYFALLAPLARGITDPVVLLVTLRLIAAAGNLLFLAGLATVATMCGCPGRLVAILGTALVAFHPAVLVFLAEFRIDGWGYALAVWSIVWFLRSRRTWRHMVLGAGTGIATLLFCPKLALLPPMILVFEQIRARSSLRNALWAFGTYALGVGLAAGLFWLWLMVNRIDVNLVFACLVRYNSLYNFHSGYGHGLLREIVGQPTLSVPVLAAFVAWLMHCIRARTFPATYPAALALWLCAHAMLVSCWYKQYYGPWFLFASGFFPSLYAVLKAFSKRIADAVFLGLCALSIVMSGAIAYTWMTPHKSQDEGNFLRVVNEITNPEDYIVAPPPLHPIYRRDTFYVWFNTYDPAGYETEEIMEGIPLLHDFASERYYREELEVHPPALVVLWSITCPQRQKAVLEKFLQERGYVSLAIGNVPVAVRPDSLERFMRKHTPQRPRLSGPEP
jgi:hypothetical protein